MIPRDSRDDNNNPKGEDLSTYKVVYPGDLVLNKMKTWQGSLGISEFEGIVSPAYIVCSVHGDFNRQYLHLLLRSRRYIDHYNRLSFGVRVDQWDMRYQDFKQIPIILPPILEQNAIVHFLTHFDTRIRRYIRTKRRQIELLNEQKQAVIQQAVTRGLDPNVRMKSSGVQWLGDVPEHWEVVRSKRTFIPRTELARANDIQLSATQAYGVISQDEFEQKVGRRVVKIFRNLEKRRHVEVNDFVISMRSFQGGLERAWASGCIRSSYVVLKPIRPLDVGYFSYVFKSFGYIKALQTTANFIRDGQDLNYDNFCGVDLPLPPLDEQRQIAENLDVATANIVKKIEITEKEISLLREYISCITAKLVTGKFDLRGIEFRSASPLESIELLSDDQDTFLDEASEIVEEVEYADD